MNKVIKAEITHTLEFDKNGFLEWENQGNFDGEQLPRTEAEMFEFIREELYEILINATKDDEIWNMINVQLIEREAN